jgi:hypothetical protein
LEVIKIAISWVRGSQVESELRNLMSMLRERLGLLPEKTPGPETPLSPDQFVQKLYHFIRLMPALKIVLDDIHEAFARYVIKPDCYAEQVRLTRVCTPIHEFLSILGEEQSKNLKVKARGGLLKSALLDFNKHQEEVEKQIRHFCDRYGAEIRANQPVDAREDIQLQLDKLIRCYELVLKMAGSLYTQL